MNLKQRLAFYKSKIGHNGITDWRAIVSRFHYWNKSPLVNRSQNGAWCDRSRFIENPSAVGLRFVDFADKIVDIRHTGWFCDDIQDRTLRGAVWQLPARNGAPVYVYGWQSSDDENAAFICFIVQTEKRDAAWLANSMAESDAEKEREENAKYRAEQDIENAREAIHELNKEALPLIKEIKKAGSFSPAICQALKAQLRTMFNKRKAQFELIATRERDYWSAVE